MRHPLLGLSSILLDADCRTVRLVNAAGSSTVYTRLADNSWASDDQESDPLHTEELLDLLQDQFGTGADRLECSLETENVIYVLEKGSVKMRREPRAAETSEADDPGMKKLAEALGIPKSRRRPKLLQAVQFCRIVENAVQSRCPGRIRILDVACGRSYLGFVLAHRLSVGGRQVELRGVDFDPQLVDKCREISRTLRWNNTQFEVGDLASWSAPGESCDVLVSLHGCDTLTDDAIRIGWEAGAPLIFAAPCCQHELRHQWKQHPLQWISRYGLLEQRLADVLTDAFRCLVLEALGYRVKVLRFTAPDVTPKNLLIQAELTTGLRQETARKAREFMEQFGVRPKLAGVLEAAGLLTG